MKPKVKTTLWNCVAREILYADQIVMSDLSRSSRSIFVLIPILFVVVQSFHRGRETIAPLI